MFCWIVSSQTHKNAHIAKLMAVHKEEFSDIKNYFSDIIHNNIDLIRQLKVFRVWLVVILN